MWINIWYVKRDEGGTGLCYCGCPIVMLRPASWSYSHAIELVTYVLIPPWGPESDVWTFSNDKWKRTGSAGRHILPPSPITLSFWPQLSFLTKLLFNLSILTFGLSLCRDFSMFFFPAVKHLFGYEWQLFHYVNL